MWIYREESHGQNKRAIVLKKKKKKKMMMMKKKKKKKKKNFICQELPFLCEEIQYPVCGFALVYSFNRYSI